MKKVRIWGVICVIIVLLVIICIYFNKENVSKLKVKDGVLKNSFGRTVQLRGVSSHGIQWDLEDNIVNYDNLKLLKEDWNINVFRIAMYTEEDGYLYNKETIKNKVIDIIDNCIELKLYVIVDWHILSDNNPNIHKQEAIEFFDEISKKYSKNNNLIYEICNEPNGDNVRWESSVYPYAKDVIETIRKNSPDSLVIVGTPDWCKSVMEVIGSQLPYKNVMYAFHFYSGTHGEVYRKSLEYAIEKGVPVFVSEWGTSVADNGDQVFEKEADEWLEFLNNRNISWVNWALSNKDEATSILKKGTKEVKDENLTQSGLYVKKKIQKK